MSAKKWSVVLGLLVIASMMLTACPAPTPQVVEKIVTQVVEREKLVTQVVEKEKIATQIVEKEKLVEKVVTPTAPPIVDVKSKDPSTMIVTEIGEPEGFDPAWDYEGGGLEILQNVYEGLVFYKKESAVDFIPQLATAWKIADDGKSYTFSIRKGVKFHTGEELTPEDIAYTFQRGMLQGGTQSPQWLLIQPLFGVDFIDVADLIDPALEDDVDGLKAIAPAKLKAACEQVKAAVVADNAAGTVTFKLAQSWGPFLATLAQPWGSAMNKKWVIANKGWDGSCDTWQNFYGIRPEDNPFSTIANGTGPFKLDHWTKGQEVVLTRNDAYWRKEPAWEGGPTGPAKLARVVIKKVDEWGTRFSMLQAGDTDLAIVPRPNIDQVDPLMGEECLYNDKAASKYDCKLTANKPLRLFKGYPTTNRTDVFLNFNISVPEGGNPLVGSGKLDGKGIPSNFFSDLHVRRALAYCFDYKNYISEVLKDEAIQATTLFMLGMPGYDLNAPHYTQDLKKCAEEFKASTLKSPDGKPLWDVGFRVQIAYNTGSVERQTVSEIIADTVNQVNPKFQVETVGLPWAAFLRAQRAKSIPIFVTGWVEDIHDPHNWVVPFVTAAGAFSGLQGLPKEISDPFTALANAGVQETDPAKRAAIYKQVNQMFYEQAPDILLAVVAGRHYEQRWVQGWYYNPIYSGLAYYYPMSKK